MASRYEVEATVTSATDLKNVNWRHGNLKPYAVVYVEPHNKCSTYAAAAAASSYHWDQNLLIPFSTPRGESTLHIDIMQAETADDTTPLIGSAHIALRDVVLGREVNRTLQLKRPSGRPQGKVEVTFTVRFLGSGQRAATGARTGSGVCAVARRFGGIALAQDYSYDDGGLDYLYDDGGLYGDDDLDYLYDDGGLYGDDGLDYLYDDGGLYGDEDGLDYLYDDGGLDDNSYPATNGDLDLFECGSV